MLQVVMGEDVWLLAIWDNDLHDMVTVLFVCLGNICRSPMAEAVFRQLVMAAGLEDHIHVDSAGTGDWHVGEKAHDGTRQVLAKHNVPYDGRARQVMPADMAALDAYIIAMDQSNRKELQQRYGLHPRLFRLLDFATKTDERDVPDPYYTGQFDEVYALVVDGCQGLLQQIREEKQF
jgi:protein-tyrosine phosphatase